MATIFGLTLIVAVTGQLPTDNLPMSPPFSEDAAVRLAYMKDSVSPYRIHRTAAASPLFRLKAEPIFRLDNPVSGVKDSAIFLWTNAETGRPEATIQMFRAPTGYWIHDWTSLSTSPIVAEVRTKAVWRPKPGVTFRPVPKAPAPAANPQVRLRQLREMAEEFSAIDDFLAAGWSHLRLLPKPWLRYGKAGSGVEDGALFCIRDRDRPRSVPHDRVSLRSGRRPPMGVRLGPDDLVRGQGLVEGESGVDAPPPEGFLRPDRPVLRHVLLGGTALITTLARRLSRRQAIRSVIGNPP